MTPLREKTQILEDLEYYVTRRLGPEHKAFLDRVAEDQAISDAFNPANNNEYRLKRLATILKEMRETGVEKYLQEHKTAPLEILAAYQHHADRYPNLAKSEVGRLKIERFFNHFSDFIPSLVEYHTTNPYALVAEGVTKAIREGFSESENAILQVLGNSAEDRTSFREFLEWIQLANGDPDVDNSIQFLLDSGSLIDPSVLRDTLKDIAKYYTADPKRLTAEIIEEMPKPLADIAACIASDRPLRDGVSHLSLKLKDFVSGPFEALQNYKPNQQQRGL